MKKRAIEKLICFIACFLIANGMLRRVMPQICSLKQQYNIHL